MKIERYMTKGIQENLPIEIQLFLWELQSNLRQKEKEIDYLQVYKLSAISNQCNILQVIHHEAEEPKHEANYYLIVNQCIEAKIYIITDDYEEYLVETMIFASEY